MYNLFSLLFQCDRFCCDLIRRWIGIAIFPIIEYIFDGIFLCYRIVRVIRVIRIIRTVTVIFCPVDISCAFRTSFKIYTVTALKIFCPVIPGCIGSVCSVFDIFTLENAYFSECSSSYFKNLSCPSMEV